MASIRVTKDARQRLGELARAATGGVWVVDANRVGARFNIESEDGTVGIAMAQEQYGDRQNVQRKANADYIAAVSPPVVLALLTETDDCHAMDGARQAAWDRLNRAIEAVSNPAAGSGPDALEELLAARAEFAALVRP